jgi:hypothetical protein
MIVGGGQDGRLTVGYVWVAPDLRPHYWFLTDPTRGDLLETRTIGGQGTDLPGRLWVARTLAMKAGRHFFETGGRDPSFTWALDNVDEVTG